MNNRLQRNHRHLLGLVLVAVGACIPTKLELFNKALEEANNGPSAEAITAKRREAKEAAKAAKEAEEAAKAAEAEAAESEASEDAE